MEIFRYLRCLAADEGRLRALAARDLTSVVPSCPEWTMRDLVKHVAHVYLHKADCMHRGGEGPWPPIVEPQPPLALLDRGYSGLINEFLLREPDSPGYGWYEPDQTVRFWIRRMAHETVIHRVDAELALGEPITSVPDDLAVDGIDEVLRCFLSFGTLRWGQMYGPELTEADGSMILISSGGHGWLLRLEPSGVTVHSADADGNVAADDHGNATAVSGGDAAAVVRGDPQEVLLWLWRRTDLTAITCEGDAAALSRLRDLLEKSTQ